MNNRNKSNPLGLRGISFVEFASPDTDSLNKLFLDFGFSHTHKHSKKDIHLYQQGDIFLHVNREEVSRAAEFKAVHGPSIASMGWNFDDPVAALKLAVEKGATAVTSHDYLDRRGNPLPAIAGIGGSIIYFVAPSTPDARYENLGFLPLEHPNYRQGLGFRLIDHLTNNVHQGTMLKWANFYKDIFGFTEVRYFDIRGAKTGLVSYALRSPCGSFCIPINEGTEAESQINEYLEQYNGPGVQHLAFTTDDIIKTLTELNKTTIETLNIGDDYYEEVFDRVPGVTEDHEALKKLNILVDGDDEGYLLQIFTKHVIGPIFIEVIQRKNHQAFGEGNFGALFRSLERDQELRGVLI